MRCFVAVHVEAPAVTAALWEAAGRLPFGGIRWVAPHQYHFTLKFPGEVEDGRIEAARTAAARAASSSAPFDLALEGLGAFPPSGPPRVVWAGCGEGAEPLVSLAKAVEAEFLEAGFPREIRPFAPHLTIGRIKDPRAVPGRPFREAVARAAGDRFGTIRVRELVFFRSDLSSAGPTHTPLARLPLRSP